MMAGGIIADPGELFRGALVTNFINVIFGLQRGLKSHNYQLYFLGAIFSSGRMEARDRFSYQLYFVTTRCSEPAR